MEVKPHREIRKRSRRVKNTPHPIAANLLQRRHVDISGADMAMAKPNDQIAREIVREKNKLFVFAMGSV